MAAAGLLYPFEFVFFVPYISATKACKQLLENIKNLEINGSKILLTIIYKLVNGVFENKIN